MVIQWGKIAAVAGLWALIGCLGAGCGGEEPAAKSTDSGAIADLTGADQPSEPLDTAATSGSDTGLVFDVPADFSGGTDAGGLDLVSAKKCNLASPQPGGCGWSCTENAACSFGYCVPSRADRLCTTSCQYSAECPEGWSCAQLAGAPDTVYGCLPSSPNLGRPCLADLDCVLTVGQTVAGLGDVCLAQGTEGSFCASDCAATGVCPSGFGCKTQKLASGKEKKLCVAEQLDSNCTPRFELDKAETQCSNANIAGVCMGRRHCSKGKLSDCDAKTAATEQCNSADDDCDGVTDEPVTDGSCQVTVGALACPGTPLCIGGKTTCIGPEPSEEACNGKDDDCNGKTDEGCDDDKDGFCDAAMGYGPGTKACAKGAGDCDDKDAGRNPTAKESCNSADDNCNGLTDSDDPLLPLHDPQKCEQQKGVCAGALKGAALCQGGQWQACTATDYQKANPYYAKGEVCDDKDNDCNGQGDDGCNDDGDGYCDAAMATIGFPLTCSKGGGDCSDADSSIGPGLAESCDGKDQGCNGVTDEGCDDDKDGQCDDSMAYQGTPTVCPKGSGDCDDQNAKRFKGALETCNGYDDNCVAGADETFPELGISCSDGKGICKASGTYTCSADGSQAVCSVAAGKPQQEICDNLDNDCNGSTDEGCDDDKDGYCDSAMATAGKPTACPKGAGDCDDAALKVYPGAKEVCDGLDNDCDAKTDASDGDLLLDDPQLCEKQTGTCQGSKKPLDLCAGGKWLACNAEGYALWNSSYSLAEKCDNQDNDCNGSADEGCDDDNDGYCNKNMLSLGAVTTCNKGLGDCDDKDPGVWPGAEELCDDKDNNCNIQVDEDCDADGDNYCSVDRKVAPGFKPKVCPGGGGDCKDSDVKVNPGVTELCADFVDNNCSGKTDEGCAPTVIGFAGEGGPNFSTEGLLQCAGYLDKSNAEDIPLAWGIDCADKNWTRLRVACGASKDPAQLRWIDVKKNVFATGLLNKAEFGLINNSNFSLGAENLIKCDADNPNAARSWWVSALGCGEFLPTLTVNNTSCEYEASGCFGLGLSGPRYLFVYVGK